MMFAFENQNELETNFFQGFFAEFLSEFGSEVSADYPGQIHINQEPTDLL